MTRGGRLPDPGLAALCARCGDPREAHGGPRHYGACPDQSGLRAARFRLAEADKPPPSMVGIVRHAKEIYDAETRRIDRLHQKIEQSARRRAEALASLHDNSGMSHAEIGLLIGRSAPRVGQIIGSLRTEAAR